jgi:hypothetical protein
MRKCYSSRRVAQLFAILLLTSASLLTGGGCTSLKTPSYFEWIEARNRVLTPTRITSYWKAYALKTEGSQPQRALGGRVMFYDDVDNQSIRVEGAVTFFVYDAAETDPDKAKPLIVYQFTPERVEQAYSKSELGHSYSFIIPFDDMDGPEMNVLIHPRIDTIEDGVRVIAQEPSRLYLPGRPTETSSETMQAEDTASPSATDENRVEQASFEETPTSDSRYEPRTMNTETIDVSPGMRQRLESPLSDEERERIERVGRYSFPLPSEFHSQNGELPSGLYDDSVQESATLPVTYAEPEEALETVIDMSPARGAAHPTPTADHPVVPPSPTRRY